VVEIGSARARSWTVLARAPWREIGADASLRALGVVEPDAADVLVDEVMDAPAELSCAGTARIALGREELGSVTAFGGRPLPDRDRATLELLARESGLIVKNAILREEAAALARTDALTGISNRREASERLEMEFERVRRHGGELSVAICDVDRFKSVNDTYGHGAGDDVLRTVARTLAKTARKTDLVARWGGEEFLIVLTSTHRSGAAIAAERMRSNVEAAPGSPQVTMSVGVASAPASSIASLLARADAALYRAKHEGRNCVRAGESE
jgi:diguanylate cyclase (GGDEF)-like protein